MSKWKLRDLNDITIVEIYESSVGSVAFSYNSLGMAKAAENSPIKFQYPDNVAESIANANEYKAAFLKESSKIEKTPRRIKEANDFIKLNEDNIEAAETSGRRLNVPHTEEVIDYLKDANDIIRKYLES